VIRCVLNTNVIVAGLRSPTGASAALIGQALDREFTLLVSLPLALEYEAACCEPGQRLASGLDEEEVRTVIAALCAVAEPVTAHFLWRPQLRDPADEMVLDSAVNGRADALVTFNRRDFSGVVERFGMAILSPREALGRIRS